MKKDKRIYIGLLFLFLISFTSQVRLLVQNRSSTKVFSVRDPFSPLIDSHQCISKIVPQNEPIFFFQSDELQKNSYYSKQFISQYLLVPHVLLEGGNSHYAVGLFQSKDETIVYPSSEVPPGFHQIKNCGNGYVVFEKE